MLNRSKLAAVGLLAAVFVAGGLAGWGGREAVEHDGHAPGGGRGPDAMVAYLSRELDLSAAQRDSVRAIFARHRPETDSLWARVRPRFDSIKARMRAEIDAQLTPEQRTRHQQLIDKAEHLRRERQGGDSTKSKAEGGRN
jgi:Spy/CpxP family protein refolding chaperone